MEDLYHVGIKALITNQIGKILLCKVNPTSLRDNKHGEYWDLPGGRIHRGSTPDETLRREVWEELGVPNIAIGRLLGMMLSNIRIPLQDGSDVGLILGVYECTLPADAELQRSDEHTACEWLESAEAAKRLEIKYPTEFCELIASL